MSINELLTMPTRRDRWGRYMVKSPSGKVVGYTRATTIAKTLDDGGGLLGWGKRMVALGLASRPDILALVASTDSNDKKALDQLCERAAEAGGSTIRRDQGIALHAALEQSWHDPSTAQPLFAADVHAVPKALKEAGLAVVDGLAERIVVNDTYSVAGTFDLVLTDGTTQYVADVKTGSSLLGALAFSIQLAIYANADNLYTQGDAKDGSEDIRDEMPVLSSSRGVILHVQPNSGHCDLHWIDLEIGADALELAMKVREIRKAKPLGRIEGKVIPTEDEAVELIEKAFPGAVEMPLVSDAWRAWMTERIAQLIKAGAVEQVKQLWPAEVPTLKSGKPITVDNGDLIDEIVSKIEGKIEAPFPSSNPMAPERAETWVDRATKIDEGKKATQATVKRINKMAAELNPQARAWVAMTLADATVAGRSLKLSGTDGEPTERRALLCEALCRIGHLDVGEIHDLLEKVANRPLKDAESYGELVGSFSIAQAKALLALADQLEVANAA